MVGIVIIDTDYVTENGKPVIRIFKIENGEFKIEYDRDFQPYIYALLKDDSAIEEVKKITGERHGKVVKIVKAEKVQKKFLGKPIEVWKLIFQHPQDVPAIRNKIREHPAVIDIFEYDIPFAKRYLIDKNLVPMEGDEKLKLMAFDIETFYTEGQEFGEGQIIMISYADEEEAKVITWKKIDLPYVEVVSSEREMIKRFVQIVREKDPDVLITYNGDNFDVPYLVKRARKLGVKLMLGRDKENSEPKIERMGNRFAVEIKGRIHFDLFPVVRRTVNLPHYTLEAVYEAVLGKKKTKLQAEEISMIWESREGMKALAQYSMEDAKATYELGKEFFPMEAELSKLIAQSVWDVSRSSTGNLVEWFLLRIAYQKNELAPNKPSNEEYQRRLRTTYIGGYVKEPERGLWGNIVYLDFRALYPSIIVEHNISPDTLEREGCKNYDKAPIVGYRFCKDFPGFIPSILKSLIEERQAVKKKMKETSGVEQKMLDYRQRALKILANSFYGYMGYPKARWYSKESAESVTAWGRYYIETTIKEIENWGFKVLYADSVSGDTEVIIREKGEVKFVKIEDLFKNVEYKLGEKEYCTLQDVEALTLNDNGKLVWKKVPYVMRHLARKKMYRVFSGEKYVDVTEDHSIIVYKDGKFVEAKPINLNDNMKLILYNDGEIIFSDVTSVIEIEYKDYVYDIEVEDTHRFFANGILVHNTDGFYATLPGEKPEAIKQKAKEFLKYINSKLPGMLELEFEGFYTRGFFVTKKRYAVIDEEGRITTRGLEVVRRDWSAIAKETQAKVLEAILKDGSVEKAVKIVKQVVEDLANYRVPVEKLVIYEQITRELSAYKATGPHIAIAKRLKAKGVKVKPGMIINYVVLRGDKKISDRAILLDEYDPKKHKYDPDYYIHNQVLPAVLRILEAFGYKEKDLEYQKTKQMGLDAWFKSKR
jgi:DNA polymerase I